jgi:uncharacterized protein YyaL (SSP411 family)
MKMIPMQLPAVAASAVLLLAAVSRALAQPETIEWLNNYKEALAEARKTQKPIFLEFRCEP